MTFLHYPQVKIPAWPAALVPRRRTLHIEQRSSVFESPVTRTTQTQRMPGGAWTLSCEFAALDEDEARLVRAFLAKLRRSQGYAYWPAVPGTTPHPQPFSEAIGFEGFMSGEITNTEPHIASALARNRLLTKQIDINDVTPGTFISVDDIWGWRHLHLVSKAAQAAEGVELTIEPPLRAELPPGARLHYDNASGVFVLASDDAAQLVQNADGFYSFSVTLVQAMPPRLFTGDTAPVVPPALNQAPVAPETPRAAPTLLFLWEDGGPLDTDRVTPNPELQLRVGVGAGVGAAATQAGDVLRIMSGTLKVFERVLTPADAENGLVYPVFTVPDGVHNLVGTIVSPTGVVSAPSATLTVVVDRSEPIMTRATKAGSVLYMYVRVTFAPMHTVAPPVSAFTLTRNGAPIEITDVTVAQDGIVRLTTTETAVNAASEYRLSYTPQSPYLQNLSGYFTPAFSDWRVQLDQIIVRPSSGIPTSHDEILEQARDVYAAHDAGSSVYPTPSPSHGPVIGATFAWSVAGVSDGEPHALLYDVTQDVAEYFNVAEFGTVDMQPLAYPLTRPFAGQDTAGAHFVVVPFTWILATS